MSRRQGRRTVITGAASGIGDQAARLVVAEGASVVLADVAEEGAVERAVEGSRSTFGGLDCIVDNAGNPGSLGRVEEIDMALFDRTVGIHRRGVFLGIRAAARVMRPQGHGSIINTASVASLQANYAGHDYSAAKAAIAHLTRTTANELGEVGVRVNAICPGGIATAIFGRGAGLDGDAARSTIAVMEVVLAEVAPMKRSGDAPGHRRVRPVAGQRFVELRERPGDRRGRRADHGTDLPHMACPHRVDGGTAGRHPEPAG